MTAAARPDDARLRGVVFLTCSMLFMVLMAATTRQLRLDDYPTTQIVWARYVFNLALVLALVPHRLLTLLQSRNPLLQIVRAAIILVGAFIFVVALRYVTVADLVAVTFMSPIMITAFSAPLLKERVSWHSWVAIGVAFLGMLVIVRPGFGLVHWAALLPLLLAFCYASNQLIIRMIGYLDHPMTSLAYIALIGSVVTTAIVPFDWRDPDPIGWVWLIATGVIAGLAHLTMIRAYERAAAPVIAPFIYTELLWAIVVGYLAFGEMPDLWTMVGAAIIASCGLFILGRERRPRAVG
ncbi:MAG: DMT family transporter [Alphaproteobacteria bacterium]|nr:DMT family transporter [Alphaproteobacteria bacterium]